LERDDWEHGAFTKALLEELTNMVSGRDPVTSGTLADRVKRRVQQLTSNQQNPTPISLDSIDLLLEQSSGQMSMLGTVAGEVREWVPSLGMKFAWCPPGVFTMGSPAGEVGRNEDEVQRTVRLSQGFWMSQTEVTRGQFFRFVSATGYVTEGERDGKGGYGLDSDGNLAQKPEYTWRKPEFTQTDSHPVVNVSWNDAVAFCEWLSKVEGKRYRLPTEAEWEYACRAGSTTAYINGNDPEGLTKVGNVADATAKAKYPDLTAVTSSDGYVNTSPLGLFSENRWNLYDMHGNVFEWCSDWYGEYSSSDVLDPQGASTGSFRVGRGGSWGDQASYCRSANRVGNDPSDRFFSLGFRLLLSPSVK
jgi:formylglycine-generating enzyme required for sulfatase activity